MIATIKDIEPSLRVADRDALETQSFSRLGDAAGWRVVGAIISASAIVVTVITAVAIAIHNQDLTRLDAALIESMGGSRAGLAFEATDPDIPFRRHGLGHSAALAGSLECVS